MAPAAMTYDQAKSQATMILAQIGEHTEAIHEKRIELAALKGYMSGFQAGQANPPEPPPIPPIVE